MELMMNVMRFFVSTVRVLAAVIYCVVGFAACITALMFVWSFLAGFVPFAGALAHGGVSLPSFAVVTFVVALILAVVACDIYFRFTRRYIADHDNAA
jgi:hypothetical protein